MFVFIDTYFAHEVEEVKDQGWGGGRGRILRGSKPSGEPRRMTGLIPEQGKFPGREDNICEDTGA